MVERQPTRAPGWLFGLAVVVAWCLGAELAAFTAIGKTLPARVPGLVIWAIVALSVAFLVVTGRRQVAGGRQTGRLIAQLKDALGSFGMLTETSLAALPLAELLDQLLGRLCEVLDTEFAAIFLTGDRSEYTVQASHGLDTSTLATLSVAPGLGLIGSVAATRVPHAVGDADRLGLLSSQLHVPLASAAGCPILVQGKLTGVCVVGSSAARPFDERRLQLLQLVADRAGVEIERTRLGEAHSRSSADAEQARLLAVILADASEVLLTAKDDYTANLGGLREVVVPEFADHCSIELVDDAADLPTARPPGDDPLRRATPAGPAAADPDAADPDAAGPSSSIVTAIGVGDSRFGTMTFTRGPHRPAYEPREVTVAIELASRVAVTVERVRRYREARDAASAAQRMAAKLHELVEASIDVQELRNESEVLTRIAERARQVFDAPAAMVTAGVHTDAPVQALARSDHPTVLTRPAGAEPAADVPCAPGDQSRSGRGDGWLSAPIAGPRGTAGGTVAICRPPQGALNTDDEAVLVLLAQMASTALDNTQLYRATQTSEARWRVLVEAAPTGIVEVDLDGGILWCNPAALVLFGWPGPEAELGPLRATGAPADPPWGGATPSFTPETAARLGELRSEVMEGTLVVDRELTAMSTGGQIRDLAVSAAVLPSPGGGIHGALILVADVTDRRRLEVELRRAQRMEAIGHLAGGVAHDFNNLLTLITGYTDLLKRRLEDDHRSTELVESIQAAATRASVLTSQLLSISRRQVAHPVVLAPVEALRSEAEVLERILGAGIELRWALRPEAGRVSIDPGQLEQVILNLAINARDAMPDGGSLDISVSPEQLDLVRSCDLVLPPGPYIRIALADTGTGMDPETVRRCFEPLFTTKGPSRGSGLGLAAVKAVVGGSGGAVRAVSTLGQGTTFEVYLPAVGAGVAATGRPRSPAEEGQTVLVAEDDEALRRLMSRVLTRDGYRVLEAAGGCEALEVAGKWPGAIDAVISDVVMPGMRGPEMAATLLSTRPATRVLFVSGDTDGSVLLATPSDPPSFLAKPFKPSQLVARVRELLG